MCIFKVIYIPTYIYTYYCNGDYAKWNGSFPPLQADTYVLFGICKAVLHLYALILIIHK
jgi:hypothetical protein